MKFNILYILIPAAIYGCYHIINDLQGQSVQTFYGTAETEPQTLNFEHAVLVKDLRTLMGNQVKKGDTLAILYRSELDKTTIERLADINQVEVERNAKNQVIDKDKDLIVVRNNAKLSDIQAQIRILQTDDSLKNSVKNAIYNNIPQDNRLLREKINALKEEILQVEKQTREQLQQLEIQRQSLQNITQAKIAQVQQDLDYVKLEKSKLFLIAPIDGFVEQVNMGKNMLIPAYRDLIKINPRKPNKIVGFIHETSDIPFQLGDSVTLESSVRLPIKAKGTIVGSNPKLVELPYRLRKFTELRAWGREVYIEVSDTNGFYIGEKIFISLKIAPPQ
jgi:multidrug resistance efflux pump